MKLIVFFESLLIFLVCTIGCSNPKISESDKLWLDIFAKSLDNPQSFKFEDWAGTIYNVQYKFDTNIDSVNNVLWEKIGKIYETRNGKNDDFVYTKMDTLKVEYYANKAMRYSFIIPVPDSIHTYDALQWTALSNAEKYRESFSSKIMYEKMIAKVINYMSPAHIDTVSIKKFFRYKHKNAYGVEESTIGYITDY